MADFVEIHTDGSCKVNPGGPGGWGVVLQYGSHRRELHGSDPSTTNQRMELMAAIQALNALTRPSKVVLYTDSQYVCQGITTWIHTWKKKGWRNAARQDVKNADLWRQLDEAAQRHDIDWRWVKGHAGNPGNERADKLADRGAREAMNP